MRTFALLSLALCWLFAAVPALMVLLGWAMIQPIVIEARVAGTALSADIAAGGSPYVDSPWRSPPKSSTQTLDSSGCFWSMSTVGSRAARRSAAESSSGMPMITMPST